jgi:hypothetical protein
VGRVVSGYRVELPKVLHYIALITALCQYTIATACDIVISAYNRTATRIGIRMDQNPLRAPTTVNS